MDKKLLDHMDSLTAQFFKKGWQLVNNDAVEVVQSFLRFDRLFGEFNATIITFVRKVSDSSRMHGVV